VISLEIPGAKASFLPRAYLGLISAILDAEQRAADQPARLKATVADVIEDPA